jgi:hypothetical protein
MLTLTEKQQTFSILLSHLIKFAYESGYKLTMGETYRPPEMAAIYAKQGKGIKNSLHCRRLAIDLMLFKGNKYLVKTDEYKFLGEHWESFSTPDAVCCWGGRFGDGGHFSIADGGQK